MRHFMLSAAALTALSAVQAEAAPMQAVFTATLDNITDDRGLFSEETASAGTTVTLAYFYDPEKFVPVYNGGFDGASAYGGTRESTVSPITSASIRIGATTYAFAPTEYGVIRLFNDLGEIWSTPASTNLVTYFADSDTDWLDISLIGGSSPALFYADLSTAYDLIFSTDAKVNLSTFGSFQVDDEGNEFFTGVDFTVTGLSISPYAAGPTDPTDPPVSPVPLPAGAPLVMTGLAALVGLRLRRRA